MVRRRIRMVLAGLAFGIAAMVSIAPGAVAEPAQPSPTTPAAPSATSTTDELTDMVLEALEHGPAQPPAPR